MNHKRTQNQAYSMNQKTELNKKPKQKRDRKLLEEICKLINNSGFIENTNDKVDTKTDPSNKLYLFFISSLLKFADENRLWKFNAINGLPIKIYEELREEDWEENECPFHEKAEILRQIKPNDFDKDDVRLQIRDEDSKLIAKVKEVTKLKTNDELIGRDPDTKRLRGQNAKKNLTNFRTVALNRLLEIVIENYVKTGNKIHHDLVILQLKKEGYKNPDKYIYNQVANAHRFLDAMGFLGYKLVSIL